MKNSINTERSYKSDFFMLKVSISIWPTFKKKKKKSLVQNIV